MFGQFMKLDEILGWVQGLCACFINLMNSYRSNTGVGGRRPARKALLSSHLPRRHRTSSQLSAGLEAALVSPGIFVSSFARSRQERLPRGAWQLEKTFSKGLSECLAPRCSTKMNSWYCY